MGVRSSKEANEDVFEGGLRWWTGERSILKIFHREIHRLQSFVIDATRVADGRVVMLKRIEKNEFVSGTETEIAYYVSLLALQDDPDNHCVCILEVLRKLGDDSFEVLVMPLLRPFDSPRIETVGEGVDFFLQAIKGLQFLYRHRIAHRSVE